MKGAIPAEGDVVVDAEGQPVGSVSDVILDLPSGRASLAVIRMEAILGLEDKDFAVRLDALIPRGSGVVMLRADREELRVPQTTTLLLV